MHFWMCGLGCGSILWHWEALIVSWLSSWSDSCLSLIGWKGIINWPLTWPPYLKRVKRDLFDSAKREWHMLALFSWFHLLICSLIWSSKKGLTHADLSLVEWASFVFMWPTYSRAPEGTDTCLPFIGWMGAISMYVTHLFEGTRRDWHMLTFHWLNGHH